MYTALLPCHKASLIVEVDGEIHTTQEESDQERDHVMEINGYQVWRIKDQEVRANLNDVLDQILAALHERSRPPA